MSHEARDDRRDPIAAHHEAEARLYSARLLRDLGDPSFDPAEEDAILDEMEALWYEMSADQRRVLDAERAARLAAMSLPAVAVRDARFVDVNDEDHARRGLPPLRKAS